MSGLEFRVVPRLCVLKFRGGWRGRQAWRAPTDLILCCVRRSPPPLFKYATDWNITLDGVPGTVQLYANSPDRASALAGSASYPWELSIRVARKDAGDRLHSILDLIGSAAVQLGQVGWDATPSYTNTQTTWVQRS